MLRALASNESHSRLFRVDLLLYNTSTKESGYIDTCAMVYKRANNNKLRQQSSSFQESISHAY